MRIFGLKNCDTCRKAIKQLADCKQNLSYVDVRADGISKEDLTKIVEIFGDAAINRASTTWRSLSDEAREKPTLELLADHPTLMKRPVIEADGQWTIGWKADVQAKWLGE